MRKFKIKCEKCDTKVPFEFSDQDILPDLVQCDWCGFMNKLSLQKNNIIKKYMTQDKEKLQSRILTLQEEIVGLRKEISEQPRVDELHRKNFTMLLGKPEDKILSWAEVYFELGYLKGKVWKAQAKGKTYSNDEATAFELSYFDRVINDGHTIKKIGGDHFRVDDRLDIFPSSREYSDLETGVSGIYVSQYILPNLVHHILSPKH